MVCHYTSFETFLKILNGIKTFNGKKFLELYATHIDKVNDPTEMKISKKQFLELLRFYEKKYKVERSRSLADKVASFDETKFQRVCDFERSEHAPYITCFSKKDDFIPMWSLYGDKAHGVCLGFTENIGSEVVEGGCEPVLFGEVAYGDYRKSDSIRRVFEFYYNYIWRKCDDNTENIVQEMYFVMSPFIKNNAYKYENEYRMCLYNFKGDADGTSYDKDQVHVPLHIPLTSLKEVVLGTKLPSEITENMLVRYFEENGYNIPIKRSEIPFR